ncbi:DNA-binding protein [Verrucomicrobia bacterium LW23]|nr:DNA-binding protein [Verrucomicrobia bacterium LW23]
MTPPPPSTDISADELAALNTQLARSSLAKLSKIAPNLPRVVSLHVQSPRSEEPEALFIPREACELLCEILRAMAEGRSVQIIPQQARLTTQEAADYLGVSRPYVVKLLEDGEIPHEMVGTHRRIKYEDLIAYDREDRKRRKKVREEVTALSEDMGLYADDQD